MRRTVFLDTSYFLALIRKKDMHHDAVLDVAENYTGSFVTTDLVLVEFANSLSQPPYRATASKVIEKIRTDTKIKVLSFGSESMEKALALYIDRPDKGWGLVDCFSFVVMKEERLKMAFSFDEHFRQAGFEVPLLEC